MDFRCIEPNFQDFRTPDDGIISDTHDEQVFMNVKDIKCGCNTLKFEHENVDSLLSLSQFVGRALSMLVLINPLGTGDLKFYHSQRLSTFWGLLFFLLNQSFICHVNQFSSLFTIL